ncbi:hypothetical protein B0T25DRAFT_542694 [Lasiosphaeria hispida]|uniref:Uncharacterized protein n=1 Tax=Lasiosphaeria hispida TaxID=260671 RepID=A0AAJ0HHW8_9PEZI|nr:hypothetical protein B0T25DRAFT_542694 [Lasiosphaeria hispida]
MDQDPPGIMFVFYNPESNSQSSKRPTPQPSEAKPKWESTVDRILNGLRSNRQHSAVSFLQSLPVFSAGEPLAIAQQLSEDIQKDTNQETKGFKELVLVTLCVVLHQCNIHTPEQVDEILLRISRTQTTRYLDVLKRGAKVANEVITEWAMQQNDFDDGVLHLLGRATEALYTTRFSIHHWGIIADHKQKSKQRIRSFPLPVASPGPSVPLLIPPVIELITSGNIKSDEVYQCFEYGSTCFADSDAIVRIYSALQTVGITNSHSEVSV